MSAVDVGAIAGGQLAATNCVVDERVAPERVARRRARRPHWEGLALSASPWTGLAYAAFLGAVADARDDPSSPPDDWHPPWNGRVGSAGWGRSRRSGVIR